MKFRGKGNFVIEIHELSLGVSNLALSWMPKSALTTAWIRENMDVVGGISIPMDK